VDAFPELRLADPLEDPDPEVIARAPPRPSRPPDPADTVVSPPCPDLEEPEERTRAPAFDSALTESPVVMVTVPEFPRVDPDCK